MFHINYVVINTKVTDYFESDLKNGIDKDFLLIPKTPFVTKTNSGICQYAPAGRLHISPNYFHSLYKMSFGRTFMQDIIESRIQYAKYFLAYSNHPVNIIAANCGYNNTEHFCRQFKKTTGLTPLQYRKNKIHTGSR